MDPQQERELDDLIARIDDDEGQAESASAAPTDAEDIASADPDGQPEGDAGDVADDSAEEDDGQEPDEGDGSYEVNVADLTPVDAATQGQSDLGEMAALRDEVNQLRGFVSHSQQQAEQAEFRQFLESLKGMDPDEAKDAVAVRIANSYVALQKRVAEQDQAAAQWQANQYEAQQRDRAIQFLAQGGRRVETPQGPKFVANPRLALTEVETDFIREAAEGGTNPLALERMAQRFVDQRTAANGDKRRSKQQADSKNGAARTLAGAGAAKRPAKTYSSDEAGLDAYLDDLLG
jgi:hypothetical protein